MTKISGYNVYLVPEGCDEEFVGYATSLRCAHRLAAEAARTGRTLPRSLYATARAAGHCDGISAPDQHQQDDEPTAWIGRGGQYAVVAIRADAEAQQ